MSGDDAYKVKVESARFELTKIKMNPAVLNNDSMGLLESNARYPIRRNEIKTFRIPKGNMQTVKKSLFSGQLPRRLVIGLLDFQALTGHNKKNPFNFQHFNLNYLCVHVDGERVPTRLLTPDYTNGHFVRAFETLFTGVGIKNEDKSVDIRRIDYPRGYTVYVLHLCPGEPDSMAYDLVQNGTAHLETKFGTPLFNTVSTIVYAEFENLIEISSFRDVILDY